MRAIELHGVGKRYWKLEERAMLLRSLLPFARPKRSEFWALRDVDLAVERGETIGVIGRNGAGKTTLLRTLAGVTRPTTGTATMTGRIAPLISVGVGFHREMTGRENVLLNAMILGLPLDEAKARFDEIVSFAELHDFIDTPVKFYSSGMFMRLGFAVAIHTDPDVLLIDEVLAVGDLAFQVKCLERLRDLQQRGTTIVLVSHSMHAIRALCPRTVLLRGGHLEHDGETERAIARHHELLSADSDAAGRDHHEQQFLGGLTILDRWFHDADGSVHYVYRDAPVQFGLRVRFDRDIDSPTVHVTVLAEDGRVAYRLQSPVHHSYRRFRAGETAEITVDLRARLGGGTYRVTSTVTTSDGRGILADDPAGVLFYVDPDHLASGIADMAGTIRVDGVELTDRSPVQLVSEWLTE